MACVYCRLRFCGASVIDYVLASKVLFSYIVDFNIEPRTESTHLPILLKLQIKSKLTENLNSCSKSQYKQDNFVFSRRSEDLNIYVENIRNYFTNSFVHDLMLRIENQSLTVEDIISELVSIFSNAGIKQKIQVRNNNQPSWFDKQCREQKKLKLKLLHKFRGSRSDNDFKEYKNARKDFRNMTEEKRKAYNTTRIDTLISSINDSKSFWSKLKSLTSKRNSDDTCTISKADWLTHFENLFASEGDEDSNDNIEIDEPDDEIENLIFNSEITDDEIMYAVKSLRADKAPGPDELIPEMFISTVEIILPVLNKLFNRLFFEGTFPDLWSKSIMIPLHKKGDMNSVNNYRGISLLDTFGKIYTSILNRRLTFYVNIYGKIAESQSGYCTIDNAFILMSIIQKYLCKKKGRIYVCFVDFQKAFDSVHREKLWQVLKTVGIKGNLFKVMKDMYKCVKACVRVKNECTDYFECSVGLKQGCLLSPLIFSIFINDLADHIQNSSIKGIQLFPDVIEILLLLFADDIALISDTIGGLQKQIQILLQYCIEYKMIVNVKKTKVMVFRRGGNLSKREKWFCDGKLLEVVKGFQYVGLLFSTKMSLYRMSSELSRKGKRVLVSILQSLQQYGTLSKTVLFKIFDTKVCPMLLYGSEIWGLETRDVIERVQYYVCKRFINVSFRANNYAVLGECGRFPLYIETAKRALKYWNKILHMPEHRYVHKCYKMLYYFDALGQQNWATSIKNILNENGFGFIWEQQKISNEKVFLREFEQILRDQFIQKWWETIEQSHKLVLYKGYKTSFDFEKYLDVLKISKFRHAFSTFRLSCHNLEIEIGRHKAIDREHRTCPFGCNSIEDEYHFLMGCNKYIEIRKKYLPGKYINSPNLHKFNILMSTKNETLIQSLSLYLYHAFKLRHDILNVD